MTRDRNVLEATKTEGGLLPADVLQRIARGEKDVPGLSPRDFHLEGTETTSEAITRSWNRLLGIWAAFRAERAKLPEGDHATGLTQNRWLLPLFSELGYGRLAKQPSGTFQVGEQTFDISHAYHRSPILLVGAGVDLEKRHPTAPGASQASPHGVVQDFLNKSDHHLWGIVTNGLRLRLLRDHRSLTRLAYVELDLEAIFDGELFHAFRLVWLLCHQSRVEADRPEDCWLEKWHGIVQTDGVAALDKLRDGVKSAIETLGRGFLKPNAQNHELKELLASGKLDKQDYYRELLRLAYRLIFLFVAEDRDLLLERGADPQVLAARRRYEQYYSTRRLRDLARKRRSSAHGDLWLALRVVFDLVNGSPGSEKKRLLLALPALGSFLWARSSLPHLAGANLPNEDLLAAVLALSTTEDRRKHRYPVNWRSLGAEELGSVYESLLELRPDISKDAATFELRLAAGHERKTTGSYYTPSSLVECLLDSALDPVVEDAVRGKCRADAEAAILGLTVCDPACGSGHFLLAAARRLARRLAQLRADYAEPSPREVTHALRDVVGRCIFGVDLNPMAVELCKVALWMEAVEPGLPLTFLDSHIQRGNALLGTTPELMAKGIPDAAWEPIEGDDRKIASALKKQNKEDAKAGVLDLGAAPVSTYARLGAGARAVDDEDDATLAAVESKERHWAELVASAAFEHQRFLADTWCAAFVWRKEPGKLREIAPTEAVFQALVGDRNRASAALREEVRRLRDQYAWFHWPLQFPQVFANGGFDVVIGNPPWEKVKLQEREYFASIRPEIATAQTAAIRAALIEELRTTDPEARRAFDLANRSAEGETACITRSGRFPHSAVGDTNTYPLFVELGMTVGHGRGRVGLVVKTGLLADYSLRGLFAHLVESRRLVSGFDFSNRRLIFPAVVANERFTLLVLSGTSSPAHQVAIAVLCEEVADLRIPARVWRLSSDDITLINPNTHTCPLFQSSRDASLVSQIYRRVPILVRENDPVAGNAWTVQYYTMLHMTNDSGGFRDLESLRGASTPPPASRWRTQDGLFAAVLEGKLFDQFDHRHGTFLGVPRGSRFGVKAEPNHPTSFERGDPSYDCLPRYWVSDEAVARDYANRLSFRPSAVLAFRDVCRTHTDLRTVRAAITPSHGAGNKAPLLIFPRLEEGEHARRSLLLCALLNAFVLDYVARQKFAGGSLNKYVLLQFPVVPPRVFEETCQWAGPGSVGDFVRPLALELSYTAWDLEHFARDVRCEGPPFRWDPERRFLLRCELDAAFFHLYGLSRDDTDYVMDTFPIVRKNDERAHGEYRTKRVILEIYDAMAEAAHTGKPYQTRLDPPPADPDCAHPAKGRPPTNDASTSNDRT